MRHRVVKAPARAWFGRWCESTSSPKSAGSCGPSSNQHRAAAAISHRGFIRAESSLQRSQMGRTQRHLQYGSGLDECEAGQHPLGPVCECRLMVSE